MREALPARRAARTFEVEALGVTMLMTVGYYEDGRPGEVFTSSIRSGVQVEAIARDAAIAVSMCLQHGVSLETLSRAVTRERSGEASSLMGALIDRLLKDQNS